MDSDYKLLGVPFNVSLKRLKRKYHKLAKKVHPDKKKLSPNTAHTKFIELSDAYQRIKKEIERKNDEKYIAKIKAWRKRRLQRKKEEEDKLIRAREREKYIMNVKLQKQKEYWEMEQQERKKRSPFKPNYYNARDSKWMKDQK